MKKVLALVLAVLMLATVAFAADVINPDLGGSVSTGKDYLPGGKIEFNDSGILSVDSTLTVKALNSTNYSISKVQWDEGKALVESVKFDDANDKVVIKLKQDYTMTTEKELRGTITLKGKKVGKGAKAPDLSVQIGGTGANKVTVGYTLADGSSDGNGGTTPYIEIDGTTGYAKTSDNSAFDASANKKYLWKVKKGTDADGKDVNYADLEFTAADGDTEVAVKVYDGDKMYLFSNVDADTDILKKFADSDADISFLNFKGTPTFNATATVRFYKEEGSYVYGLKDGKLTSVNAKWNDDEGCFVLKARTLGSYVFSDKKLSVSAETPADTNPDTGANDVVGIATALAAVALVSAAAVSLKK